MKNYSPKIGQQIFHGMKVMKLFSSQGSNFCLQYFTVHIWQFGLGVREMFKLPKTHFPIPVCTSCYIHFHFNANRQDYYYHLLLAYKVIAQSTAQGHLRAFHKFKFCTQVEYNTKHAHYINVNINGPKAEKDTTEIAKFFFY